MNTALDLATSFPEMLLQAKRRIRVLRESLKHWDSHLEAIAESSLVEDDEIHSSKTRAFWKEAWKAYVRNDPEYKELGLLQHYVTLVERPAMQREKRDLSAIKAIPIKTLYEGRLVRSGANWRGCCPFHTEKTPSFYIYTKGNTFHCFGCGAHGDVIAYHMKITGSSFIDSINLLGGDNGSAG